ILALARLALRLALRHSLGVGTTYLSLCFGSASRSVAGDAERALDYASHIGRGVIAPLQIRSEIIGLLKRVYDLRPKVVVEIGTANGGTLFLFSRMADKKAQIISIDLPCGEFGEGYRWWKAPLYRSFAMPGQHVSLIVGNSHAPETLERLERL